MAEPSPTHSVPLIKDHSIPALNTKHGKCGKKSAHIDSINDILADGDREKRFLLKKVEENMDYLNIEILKEQQQHILTGLHLQCLYDWTLFLPSMLLTSLSSILAILGGSKMVTSTSLNDRILCVIAVVGIASAFIQSLMKQLNFSGYVMMTC